jgi:hypothetical protein
MGDNIVCKGCKEGWAVETWESFDKRLPSVVFHHVQGGEDDELLQCTAKLSCVMENTTNQE